MIGLGEVFTGGLEIQKYWKIVGLIKRYTKCVKLVIKERVRYENLSLN